MTAISLVGNNSRFAAMHNEIREKRVFRMISEAPESAQKTLREAFSGSASPRRAIRAMCLTCVGYDRTAIRDCTGYSCPLWQYRPFQAGEAEEAA